MTKKTKGSKSKKDEAIRLVEDEKNYYYNQTINLRNTWEDLYKQYVGYLTKKDYPWVSNKNIPKVYQAVEILAATIAGNDPTLLCFPVGDEDENKARVIGDWIQNQWKFPLKMRGKIQTMVKQAILYGTGFMKVFWKTILDDNGKPLYDDPTAYPPNTLDIFTSPYISDTGEQESVIERFYKRADEVKNNKNYKNTSKIDEEFSTLQSGFKDSSVLDQYDLGAEAETTPRSVPLIEIYERWTRDRVITIAKGSKESVLLRDMKNPYGFIPYIVFRFKDPVLSNRLYGIGAIEPNMKLADAINSIFNQVIDIKTAVINPMFIRRRGANIDAEQCIWRPSGVIDVYDVSNDIKQLPVQDTSRSSFELLRELNNEFESGTTVTALRKGQQGGDTAFETGKLSQYLDITTNVVKQNFEETIGEIGKMLIKLNQKNVTKAKSLNYFDPDVREIVKLTIKPTDLSGDYDIRCEVDSTLQRDRNVMIKQFMDMLQLAGSDPEFSNPAAEYRLNRKQIYEDLWRYQGVPNPTKYFIKNNQSMPQPPMLEDSLSKEGLMPPMAGGKLPPKQGGFQVPEARQRGERLTPQTQMRAINQGANQL